MLWWRLRHNTPGEEPAVPGIVDVELGLQAAEPGWCPTEYLPRPAQLIALRTVLGIIDHDKVAAHELQRIVERLGLGARAAIRNDEKPEVRRQRELARCRLGALGDQSRVQSEHEYGRDLRSQRPQEGIGLIGLYGDHRA